MEERTLKDLEEAKEQVETSLKQCNFMAGMLKKYELVKDT